MTILLKHRELVTRLKKPGESILACVTPLSLDLLHMAVGIVGEVIELQEAEDADNCDHVLEELGDLHFFIEGFRQALDVQWAPVYNKQLITACCDSLTSRQLLLTAAGTLLDLIKRFTIYDKKPLDVLPVLGALQDVCTYSAARALLAGFTHDDILSHNYIKLSARYPSGSYTDGQAQQRADKTETPV